MWKRPGPWITALELILLVVWNTRECRAGVITVHFDQDVYTVNGPGEQIVAQILVDGDSSTAGIQSVVDGLFSAGVQMSFNPAKANIGGTADVVIPPEMDFFGFSPPALLSVAPPGEMAFHANVDQFQVPLPAYNGSLLAIVTMTNLATAVDSYPLNLDFSRDLGINEDFFVNGSGSTLDLEIMFVPSRVEVVPESSSAMLSLMFMAFLIGRRQLLRRPN